MSIADHNVVPGKKFWTWGNGPSGRTWDTTLSDTDGPYIELMVGAYSDNQPDYSWLQPYEARRYTMNWYPFRDIGGVKKANLDAAVNLDVDGANAKFGFYATAAHPAAVAMLKAGGRVLLRETVAISPARPYTKQIAVPAGIDPHDLTASLSDGGKELVSYSPVRLKPVPMPEVGDPAGRARRRQDQRRAVPHRSARRPVPRSGHRARTLLAGSASPRPRRRSRKHRDGHRRLQEGPLRRSRAIPPQGAGALDRPVHQSQRRRAHLLSGRRVAGPRPVRRSLHPVVQSRVERSLEIAGLLLAGRDRRQPRRYRRPRSILPAARSIPTP